MQTLASLGVSRHNTGKPRYKGDTMATAKKAKPAATTKKAAKKPTTVKRTTKKQVMGADAQTDFFEVRFSNQSVYWVIFGIAAIVFALWLFMLDAKVRDLYDQIDANNYNTSSMQTKPTGTTDEQPANPAE